jgi:endoglucanase
MYEPHSFTHQRPDGTTTTFASGLPWPADSGTPEIVIETLGAQMEAAGLSQVERMMNTVSARERIAQYFAEKLGAEPARGSFPAGGGLGQKPTTSRASGCSWVNSASS